MRLLTRARHNTPRVCTSVLFIGSVCPSVCLFVCYSTSHSSNVCSSQKRYPLPNGRRRSENKGGFP
ncbi:hypothetical protein GBAR_LOCUS12957 [Geodia barretti]|uniref:Uncharacterized protein n=1 Tax=Geodia barretti TaxID=519541 RepID=A0AA35S2E1_GEOBA|nr:hypothetical protein GBAR_LOCUS12957 [Geodia barretti]